MEHEPVKKKEEIPQLTEEQKTNLVKRVIEGKTEDEKYILTVSEWEYFHSRAEIKIIAGKVDMVLIDHSDKPGDIYRIYAIIPKTSVVELRHHVIDYNKDDDMEHVTLYVFTLAGWKSFELY